MAILNVLSATPVVAYGLRKLRDAYAGSAIRVRKSSNNAEQDIGFDINGNLDTTALSNFIGADSGYIVTWYDQIGNNNATQPTTGNQPRIVNAGVIETLNSKPAIFFDNPNNSYLTNTTIGTKSQPNSYVLVAKNNGFDRYYFASNDSFNRNDMYRRSSTGRFSIYANSTELQSTTTNSNYNVLSAIFNGANSAIYQNGTSIVSGSTGTVAINGLNIGGRSASTHLDGHMSEFIMFNVLISDTDRRYLETNQGDYYGITVANPLYPSTNVSASDTLSISIIDTSLLDTDGAPISANDTETIVITDTAILTVNISSSDLVNITVAESTIADKNISASDIITFSTTELATLDEFTYVLASDGVIISISELARTDVNINTFAIFNYTSTPRAKDFTASPKTTRFEVTK